MTTRLLLFDLDGTLVDSLDDLTSAVNHVRGSFSLPCLTAPAVRKMVGKGARNLISQALPDAPDTDLTQGLELFLEFNRIHIADQSRLYPGISHLLEKLSSQGAHMAVISNKNESLSRLILDSLASGQHFQQVCGGDTFPEMKPSPLPLQRLMEQFGTTADTTVMVGDSINDIQAGITAGVTTIGCGWGYGSEAELQLADYRVNSPAELGDIIERLS